MFVLHPLGAQASDEGAARNGGAGFFPVRAGDAVDVFGPDALLPQARASSAGNRRGAGKVVSEVNLKSHIEASRRIAQERYPEDAARRATLAVLELLDRLRAYHAPYARGGK
jgi:hypothetical protein